MICISYQALTNVETKNQLELVMKKFFAYAALLIATFSANQAFALTRAEYQFTDGKEVVFLSTFAENPNTAAIQGALNAKGYIDFDKLPDGAADDVWCRISSFGEETPLLSIECYQPHQGRTFALRDTLDPTASGTANYSGIPDVVGKLRQELRAKLQAK
jgi:hypothetical protein